jgi:hypothetical protein
VSKKTFKYGFFEKRRFSAERKRQLREGTARYIETIDDKAQTYWQNTRTLPGIDADQEGWLSDFSRDLALGK